MICWNMMGGIDWTALPIVAELVGCSDIELLIRQLLLIRENQNDGRGNLD